VGVARLAISGDLAAGVIPCWKIADCALGERLRRSQLACAHAVLADHNLNIIYYITHYMEPPGAGSGGRSRVRFPLLSGLSVVSVGPRCRICGLLSAVISCYLLLIC
jgi:hypothetical protein